MIVVIPEKVSIRIFINGFHEEDLTNMMLSHLRPGMVFFDVGAHIGYHSLLASEIVGPEGRVHSFEPTPSTFQILELNLNGKPNIVLQNLALYSSEGVIEFHDYGVRHSAFNSIDGLRMSHKQGRSASSVRYPVKTTTLDAYVEKVKVLPHFVKIDAERSEHHILPGMDRILERDRPTVCMEVGDPDFSRGSPSRELVEHLTRRKYDPFEFREGKIVRHSIRDHYVYENLLFLPR